MMARLVAQSAFLTVPTHAPSKEIEKPKRSVKMACGLETPVLSDSISLGNKLVRFGHHFRSLSPRPGSGSGCVAKEARFEAFTGTSIPSEKVITDESVKMEETLHKRVIGQDEAVKAVSRACVSLRNPNRPIASFFFYGPTGVGKSELAKALAASYFGSEEAVIRIDNFEFCLPDALSRLIGSHPGYSKGGQLTEFVRRRPNSVVIFDGFIIRPDLLNMARQILEYGRLLDGKGRTVDFSNTIMIVIMNSIDGEIKKGGRQLVFDLDKESRYNRIKSMVTESLERFAPISNSFDDVIVFRQLIKSEMKEIADVMLKVVSDRLKANGIQLHVTEKFRERMVDQGYGASEVCGAWPLCRAIRHLQECVAEKLVAGEIKEGESVTVDADSDFKCCAFLRFMDDP
ncbi:hypothetical protein GQ457_03G042720 [Hibiscus cannabinus]